MTPIEELSYQMFPELRTNVIDRPITKEKQLIDMPPLNVINCQCSESCPSSGPCENEATGDDLLCDECRKAIEKMNMFREGLFSALYISLEDSLSHCHQCDPEFNKDGDDGADNDR